MEITKAITITKANKKQREHIIALLQSETLPVEDMSVELNNFFVALDDDNVIGAIGLEQYEHYGLLRSMVVDKKYRNKNIAAQLIQELEHYAAGLNIGCMYLLTETAPQYFESKGYQRITREEVPEVLKASSEFSYVCPVSAVVMKKQLNK